MMLSILKYVYAKLALDADVSALVGENIFPNIVPDWGTTEEIKFPHIVMNRLSLTPTYTKGVGCSVDNVEVEVTCWDVSYLNNVDLIEKVRAVLENSQGVVENVTVNRCKVQSADEGFADGAYYQRIVFNFK